MTTSRQDKFFGELKDWSNRKINIIQKYLVGFVRILGSIDNVIYYVDGFAGKGVYDDASKGSPIRAAEYAKKLKEENKTYSLHCVNVEENPENYKNLQESTKHFGGVINLQGTFIDNIDKILNIINDHPTIFFLDDFGVSGFNWNSVEKIISREAPTDIWVRLDTTIIRRLDGFFKSESTGAEKKFEKLPKLFGIDDKEYLHSQLAGDSPQDRVINARNLYLGQLAQNFRNYKKEKGGYANSYLIRSIEEQSKYYLVFATGHPRGVVLANDIVYYEEEIYQSEILDYKRKQNHQLDFLNLIDPSEKEIFDFKTLELKKDIMEACKGKTLARIDICIKVFPEWFGKVAGKHFTQALKEFINEGKIVNVSGQISNLYTKFTFVD